MGALATNNAVTTISTSITAAATQIVLAGGTGELFPAAVEGKTWFFGTLYDKNNNIEIVKVTIRNGDTLTVLRGQDGTSAHKFDAGDGFDLRPTAALFNDKVSEDKLEETVTEIKTDYTSADAAVTKTLQNQIDTLDDTLTELSGTVEENGTDVSTNYYTKTDADARYLRNDTDGTLDGNLVVTGTLQLNGAATLKSTIAVTGEATFSSSVVAESVRTTSDRRLKKDIEELDSSTSLAKVHELRPVSFRWIREAEEQEPHYGFIAQEVQDYFPGAVKASDGHLSIEYSGLVAVLFSAVQELQKKVEALEKQAYPAGDF